MTLPALLFGLLIATLYGAGFHLWLGGGPSRLLLYIILAWVGFWAGHFAAELLSWTFASLGPIRLGLATLGSLAFLGIGYWLSLVDVGERG